MEDKTAIYLTNKELDEFKTFRKWQSDLDHLNDSWKQVIAYASDMGHGIFTLTVQNGTPVKINRAMQQISIGIKIDKKK